MLSRPVYSALPAITRLSPGKEAEIFSTILRRPFETRRCSMKLGRLIRVLQRTRCIVISDDFTIGLWRSAARLWLLSQSDVVFEYRL